MYNYQCIFISMSGFLFKDSSCMTDRRQEVTHYMRRNTQSDAGNESLKGEWLQEWILNWHLRNNCYGLKHKERKEECEICEKKKMAHVGSMKSDFICYVVSALNIVLCHPVPRCDCRLRLDIYSAMSLEGGVWSQIWWFSCHITEFASERRIGLRVLLVWTSRL